MSIGPGSEQQSKRIQSRTWKSLDGLPMIALPRLNPIQALIDKHLPNIKTNQGDRAEINFWAR